jgi:Tfp pilus assembly protein PilO
MSRARDIAEGILIDMTEIAKVFGIVVPCGLTTDLWSQWEDQGGQNLHLKNLQMDLASSFKRVMESLRELPRGVTIDSFVFEISEGLKTSLKVQVSVEHDEEDRKCLTFSLPIDPPKPSWV